MGYCVATYQKNPKSKKEYLGLYFLGEDGRVWVQTRQELLPVDATAVTRNHDVITSNNEAYLIEMARQDKPSQFSYQYTDNIDLAEEVRALLLAGP